MSKGPRVLVLVAEQKPEAGIPLEVAAEPVDVGTPPAVAVAIGVEHNDLVILIALLILELLASPRERERGIAVGEEDILAPLRGHDLIVPLLRGDVEALRNDGTGEVDE